MSKLHLAVHSAITNSRLTRLIPAATVAAVLSVAAPVASASAGTLVYVKNQAVYVAQPDGTQARAIAPAGNDWAWPSETDGGIIAVAGGVSRINGSFNPSGSDEIYEFDQQGKQVAGPVATEGTYSTVNDPEYVTHFRVAPDNSNVAWTDISSYADPFTAWRNPNGSGTFSTASDCCGPLSYSNPEWWGSTHLLIRHDGATLGSQPNFTFYNLSDGSNVGWNGDQAVGNASSRSSRSGSCSGSRFCSHCPPGARSGERCADRPLPRCSDGRPSVAEQRRVMLAARRRARGIRPDRFRKTVAPVARPPTTEARSLRRLLTPRRSRAKHPPTQARSMRTGAKHPTVRATRTAASG